MGLKVHIKDVNVDGKIRKYASINCPGCKEMFSREDGFLRVPVEDDLGWSYTVGVDGITIKPSLLTNMRGGLGALGVCHSFVTDGKFQFLEDSTHSLSGQTVDMLDLPDWYLKQEGFIDG